MLLYRYIMWKNTWKGAVKSLTDQTLREIQIILVDDGSSDGSGELCRQFAEKDSRIKVNKQKK